MAGISVSITADVADLTAKLAIAKQEVQAANATLRDMATQMRAAGGSASNELKAGLATAAQSAAQAQGDMSRLRTQMREATGTSSTSFNQIQGAALSFGRDLKYALAGGEFLIFKEIAQQALRTVEELFDRTAGAAARFALDTAKFSAQMGISMSEAAALAMSLDDVGSSADDYAGMVMKLTQRLREQEPALQALGLRTRDANGELLSGRALMDSALATMQRYKAGTDQNSFALYVFGRAAAGVYDLMRLSEESVRSNAELLKFFGVATGKDAARGAADLQSALANLKDVFSVFGVALGQRLMLDVTKFTEGLERLKHQLRDLLEEATKAIAIFLLIQAPLRALLDILFRQDFTAAGEEFSSSWDRVLTAFGIRVDEAKKKAKELADVAGGDKTPGGGLYGSGDRSFEDPAKRKAVNLDILENERALALQRIKQQEDANNADLASSRANAEQHKSVALLLATQKLEIERDFLKKREALNAGDEVALQKDKSKKRAIELEAAGERQRIEEQASQSEQQMRQQALADERAMASERLGIAVENLDAQQQLGRITATERIAEERRLTAETYRENLARLDQQIAMLGEGTMAWRRTMAERERLVQQFNGEVQRLDNRAALAARDSWRGIVEPIQSAFREITRGVLQGTQTWREAVRRSLADVTLSFFQARLEIELDWIAGQAAMALGAQEWANQSLLSWLFSIFGVKAAQSTANAEKVAEAGTTAIAIAAITKAEALAEIPAYAAIGAVAAGASVAAIPVVGWAMAPGVMAEHLALAMSFLSVAALDVGSMRVPQDMMALIHKDEMVIPAGIATGLRGGQNQGGTPFSAAGFGGAAATFSPHLHFHPVGKLRAKDIEGLKAAVLPQLRQAHREFLRMPGGRS